MRSCAAAVGGEALVLRLDSVRLIILQVINTDAPHVPGNDGAGHRAIRFRGFRDFMLTDVVTVGCNY